MKKKILFVINSLGVGGAEKSLISLLSAFNYDKYDVDLLLFRASGMFLELLPKQVNVLPELEFLHDNAIAAQLRHPKYFFAHIRASAGLRANARKNRLHPAQCYWKYAGMAFNPLPGHYDVAIAWGQGNPTHYVAEKVNADKKIAFINADYEAVGHNKDFDIPFYQKYDYIASVSEKLANRLCHVFPDIEQKIRTIYDINNADLIAKMANITNPFESDTSDIILVTVGRLVIPKGYDLAVQAAKMLKDLQVNFTWYFVGEGPERSKIEHMIDKYELEKQIVLAGAQNNPYVYTKNADIYVQTSKSEGYCLTLAEARILNKPVISTDFDAVHNQLKDGENGLIVEMKPEAIADAIIRMKNDDGLREHIISNLKKEKKGNIEEIEKLYQLIEG